MWNTADFRYKNLLGNYAVFLWQNVKNGENCKKLLIVWNLLKNSDIIVPYGIWGEEVCLWRMMIFR